MSSQVELQKNPMPERADPTAPGERSRGAQQPKLRWTWAVNVALVLFACYFLLPVWWLVVAASKTTGDLFGSFGLWFSHPQLWSNLGKVLTYDDGIYLRWVANSIMYAGVGAVGSTLIAAMAGYALAKYHFPGRDVLFNVILSGVLIPATALALPLFLLLSRIGLSNTYWAVLLPSLVNPFGVYLCRVYAMTAVPDSLIEAARIDGASEVRIFSSVVLRLMTPALVTVFLFQFVGIWNNYFLPLVMLSNPKLYPITLGLTSWQSFADRSPILYQLTVGGAFLSVVPLMAAMVVLQRFWRSGLVDGGVKG